jgi:hypothetical protein
MQDLLQNIGGKSAISAKQHALEEIVNGSFFRTIEQSWALSSCVRGRLAVCARTCGSHDPFGGQFLPSRQTHASYYIALTARCNFWINSLAGFDEALSQPGVVVDSSQHFLIGRMHGAEFAAGERT